MASGLVLVTGSSGRIGRAVVGELQARGRALRCFDRVPTPGVKDMVVGTLTDPACVAKAMRGVTTLIHLAATPDDADFLAEIVPNNIIGVHHVLEAAKEAGVKRIILASSGQVIWNRRNTGPWPVGVDVQPSPRYWYAAAKLFLEGAGKAFADAFDIEVIAVRLGWCPRTKEQVEEIAVTDWAQDVYLSPGDAGRFFACAAEAPGPISFAIVYATSQPVKILRYDLEAARRLLGYEPREKWPQGTQIVVRP
ncbi:MAG: NAD(P)-dependent oxidoreductase [Planctomycetes bacterium]|nr:NAD(P)-dependent oxidoreductase [Planctomycetota bacterium]